MRISVVVKRLNCKKTEIISETSKQTELNVKGEARDGKANLEIVKFFARKYKKPVRIVRGLRSKRKVVEIG